MSKNKMVKKFIGINGRDKAVWIIAYESFELKKGGSVFASYRDSTDDLTQETLEVSFFISTGNHDNIGIIEYSGKSDKGTLDMKPTNSLGSLIGQTEDGSVVQESRFFSDAPQGTLRIVEIERGFADAELA